MRFIFSDIKMHAHTFNLYFNICTSGCGITNKLTRVGSQDTLS